MGQGHQDPNIWKEKLVGLYFPLWGLDTCIQESEVGVHVLSGS